MNDDQKETQVFQNLEARIQEGLTKRDIRQLTTGSLADKHAINLHIGESTIHIHLSKDLHCFLGRFKNKPDSHYVDLNPYKAQEHGISRMHAQLHVEDAKLYLTDVDSTNGTFLNGEKLVPHVSAQLVDGDEFMLGTLAIRVEYQ